MTVTSIKTAKRPAAQVKAKAARKAAADYQTQTTEATPVDVAKPINRSTQGQATNLGRKGPRRQQTSADRQIILDRAVSAERTPTRGDVLQELAKIMDNLDRSMYAQKWSQHFRTEGSLNIPKAIANERGAVDCHRQIVDSVMVIAQIAVPGDPYLFAELQQRMSKIRAARM